MPGLHPDVWKRMAREFALQAGRNLGDVLSWGPQHPDLQVQALMRTAYFREPRGVEYDSETVADLATALDRGEAAAFWCEPCLENCLSVLWALEALTTGGADMRRVRLAITDRLWSVDPLDEAAAREAFTARVSAEEVLEPLLAVRRHLASDTHRIEPDLSILPERVARWAATSRRLSDLLPSARGIDVIDGTIHGALTERWDRAIDIVGRCGPRLASLGHRVGGGRLWERLMELSDHAFDCARAYANPTLVQADIRGEATWAATRFRITPLGLRVRDKRTDALKHRRFCRWVGGRLVTNERPLRRQG